MKRFLAALITCIPLAASAVQKTVDEKPVLNTSSIKTPSLKEKLQTLTQKNTHAANNNTLIFDLPVTYNKKVSKWVHYYQSRGQKWFREWLARSSKYMPFIQAELQRANLPTDLAFMVMIESGFSSAAVSHADAVGPWQFIAPTGNRYGLQNNWWLDERRDLKKSTLAAIRYLKDLREEFGSWYLVAASYNMGEAGLRRQIKKYQTKDYWTLVQKGALPEETQEYVPKILAAMLIAKAPNLYGFRDVEKLDPLDYEVVSVPGGTDLDGVADHLGVTRKSLKDLNAEILLGYIPRQIERHYIRVPKGAGRMVSSFTSQQATGKNAE
ncbi:MAG: lytic transglycosylase domain-containing protein [Bdellovibrionales bacterium]|nr:lytic transglycosylase domain-containing protein [Bdellovibrionales bacterium]